MICYLPKVSIEVFFLRISSRVIGLNASSLRGRYDTLLEIRIQMTLYRDDNNERNS